jgi:hypothetical protein
MKQGHRPIRLVQLLVMVVAAAALLWAVVAGGAETPGDTRLSASIPLCAVRRLIRRSTYP